MRCLALADELARRGYTTTFALDGAGRSLQDRVAEHGHEVIGADPDAMHAWSRAGGRPAGWLVIDHYQLDATWLSGVRDLARRRLVIDDLRNRPLDAEIVLDANVDATADLYRDLVPRRARLLLGPRFALLRPEFRAVPAHEIRPAASVVVVAFGGADLGDGTSMAVRAARRALPDSRIEVIVGPLYRGAVRADRWTTILRDPPDLASRLGAADLAIGAGGVSALERCAVGLPSVVVRIAANQDAVAAGLGDRGVAIDAGSLGHLSEARLAELVAGLAANPTRRAAMARAGRELVDGLGTIRVADALDRLRLRRAQATDAATLLRWVNDPETRANSVNTAPIDPDEHDRWLAARLTDPATVLLIAENGAGPVGTVRLDRRPSATEVSITIDPEHRGGLGGRVLAAGLRWVERNDPRVDLLARVRRTNAASRRIFEGHGFRAGAEDTELVELSRPARPGGRGRRAGGQVQV